MITKGMMSSNTDEWATPKELYDYLNSIFHFTLDPCASDDNYKCDKYFTKRDNGLLQKWAGYRVFCNPPYGRSISDWVEKAYSENLLYDTFIVLLLPARTDTKWFHDYIYNKHRICFLKGRLKFNDQKNSAPFPSMLVFMESKNYGS